MFSSFAPYAQRIKTSIPSLYKYKYIIGSLVVLGVFSFVILRIDSLSSPEANQQRYEEGVIQIEKVTFDEDAIKIINDLNPTDVKVGGNINDSRNNPF